MAANIKSDCNAIAKFLNHLAGPIWILQRCSSKIHPATSSGKRFSQRCIIPNATRELHSDVELSNYFGKKFCITASTKCRVEINQVNPISTGGLEFKRHFGGISVRSFLTEFTLHQSHCADHL
jgi:hypothetical protein